MPRPHGDPFKSMRNKKMIGLMTDMQYSFYRIIKTSHNTYAGIAAVNDIGDYDDPVMKGRIVIPNKYAAIFFS